MPSCPTTGLVGDQVNLSFGTVPLLAVALTSGGQTDPGVMLIGGVSIHPLVSLAPAHVAAAFDALLRQWITAAAERYVVKQIIHLVVSCSQEFV